MRKLIYSVLSSDAGMMALLPGGLYGDRAEGVPDVMPFGVLRYEGPNPGLGRHRTMRVSLWVHNETQDYTAIDDALAYARDLLVRSAGASANGVYLSTVEWLGTSGDLYDSDRRTNVKNAAFLLTGSGL